MSGGKKQPSLEETVTSRIRHFVKTCRLFCCVAFLVWPDFQSKTKIFQEKVMVHYQSWTESFSSSLSVTVTQQGAGLTREGQQQQKGGQNKKTEQNKWDASKEKQLPGGSDSVTARVSPFKIRIGSDPFPLHHSGSLSVCLCALKPFKGSWRERDRGGFLLWWY